MFVLYCLLWALSGSGILTAVDTLLYYSRPKVMYTAINFENDFLVDKTNFPSGGLLAVRGISICQIMFSRKGPNANITP